MIRLVVLGAVLSVSGLRAQGPRVYLNHVVIVVDSATYRAIAGSTFLRDTLASFQERTTTAGGGMTWSGTYLFGKSTYLELFGPGGVAGPEGSAMIGWGVEEPRSLATVRTRLASATGLAVDSLVRTRTRGTEEIPWFHAVAVAGAMTASRFPTWVMEYHAAFAKRWDPAVPAERNGIRRWQALAEVYRPERAMLEVRAARVAVDSADQDRIAMEARAFGHQVARRAGSSGLVITAPGFRLETEAATERSRGIRAIEMVIEPGRLADGKRTISPGLTVSVSGRTARWVFP